MVMIMGENLVNEKIKISIEVNKCDYLMFKTLMEYLGINPKMAINVFIKQSIRDLWIPFWITLDNTNIKILNKYFRGDDIND